MGGLRSLLSYFNPFPRLPNIGAKIASLQQNSLISDQVNAEPNSGQVILLSLSCSILSPAALLRSTSLAPALRSLNASIVSPGAGFESTGLAGLLFKNLRIRVITDLKNDISLEAEH